MKREGGGIRSTLAARGAGPVGWRPDLVGGVLVLVVCGLAAAPVRLSAQAEPRPAVIASDGGHVQVSSMGVETRFTVGSASTGADQLMMVRAVFPPGHRTTTHLHEIDEEVVYVLEGTLEVTLDGEEHRAGPGSTAFIPAGTWMSLANPGAEPATLLVLVGRGDAEECFRVLFSSDATEEASRKALADCRVRLP